MAEHIETGKKGEMLALEYLRKKGWKVLERNWRSGHREIDIIAEAGGELIIVEVKVRKHIGNERIEEHIPRAKQQNLVQAAGAYLAYAKLDIAVRFDILLLEGDKGCYRIEHLENAFGAWD